PHADNSAAIRFMTADSHTYGVIMQHVLNGFVSADVPIFERLGFPHPLSLVIGGEYRKEASKATPDSWTQLGYLWLSGASPVHGEFDVIEAFAEASLPILEDRPFAKELSIEGAARQSHYSTAGDSTSWKYGGVYAPIDGIKFRATDAVAVRAPNIGELFAPDEHGFAFVNDPCDHLYTHLGTQFRIPNCIALMSALGVKNYDPDKQDLNSDQSIPNIVGGNLHLTPETARTLTAGVVVEPEFVPGLTFSVDFYNVTIANAIEAPSAQNVADECVDLSTIDNQFCAATQRSLQATKPGAITQVTAQQINVASFKTDGVDFTLTYHQELADIFKKDFGSLDIHLIGSRLDVLSTTPLPGERPIEYANTYDGGVDGGPAPRWQANVDFVWTWDQITVDYNIDWYNAVFAWDRQTIASEPDVVARKYLHIPARFVQSLQVGVDVAKGWNVYGGIDNLFYQKPATGQNGLPVDPLGRFFYVGVKADLDFAGNGL
ncbi:MAG TPA: TonB-dependent receptor, partial [Tepidisphaeraceae bacterium]|nr:TonB-dependent receptor [Tepidisphaeraceae bacterium]